MLPNPYVILAAGVLWLASLGVSFYEGHHYAVLQQRAAALEEEKKAVETTHLEDAIGATVGQQAAEQATQVQTVTRTIIKWRTVYVSKQADSKCIVPRGFIRMHNDAARGVPPVPGPSGQSDGDPSGVAISAVGDTIAANYGTCREIRSNYLSLQDWVRKQQALPR